jgi:hypothetical protein
MFELICGLMLCGKPALAPTPQCPSDALPELQRQFNCVPSYEDYRDKPQNYQNNPNVCGEVNSVYLDTQTEEKYWREFKCPLG